MKKLFSRTLQRDVTVPCYRPFRITEGQGIDWGIWSDISAEEAVFALLADVDANPGAYCGRPDPRNLHVEAV